MSGAIEYAVSLLKHGMSDIAKAEFSKVRKAGIDNILKELAQPKGDSDSAEVKMPPKEVVTEQIPGIEVMDLEDAVAALWKEQIYAESGMGCTGPIIRISEANKEKAVQILKENQYI